MAVKAAIDDQGNPFGVFAINIELEPDEAGAYHVKSNSWTNVDGTPVDNDEVDTALSTFVMFAESLCNGHGITDPDLRQIVIDTGRATRIERDRGAGRETVINVMKAARDEQRRRDAERATPVPPLATPTSE